MAVSTCCCLAAPDLLFLRVLVCGVLLGGYMSTFLKVATNAMPKSSRYGFFPIVFLCALLNTEYTACKPDLLPANGVVCCAAVSKLCVYKLCF